MGEMRNDEGGNEVATKACRAALISTRMEKNGNPNDRKCFKSDDSWSFGSSFGLNSRLKTSFRPAFQVPSAEREKVKAGSDLRR
jgi:hypothetical protein